MGPHMNVVDAATPKRRRPQAGSGVPGSRTELGGTVRAFRPKAGVPNMRKYDESRIVSRFGLVSRAMTDSGMNVGSCSERELARFTGRLMVFADSALGRDVPVESRPPVTKIPARFLHDYSSGGALQCVLGSCFRFRASKAWPNFDFRDPARHAENISMYESAQFALRSAGFYPRQRVYIMRFFSQDAKSVLGAIVVKHGGELASNPNEATHVVFPDPPGRTEHETDAQVLVRYLAEDVYDGKKLALVHWWYHPDSYDDWVGAEEVCGVIEPERAPPGKAWRVQARWVRDLERFNEWMNELDYEVPPDYQGNSEAGFAAEEQCQHRSFGAHLRIRLRPDDLRSTPSPKRARQENDTLPVPVGDVSSNVSGLSKAVVGTSSDSSDRKIVQMATFREGMDVKSSAHGPVATDDPPVVDIPIPDFSTWFDMRNVHEIERNAMPEFFDRSSASKSEAVYRQVRDFMITTWRNYPTRYLTATAVRRKVRADACAIQRLHGFLEHWGLINFGHKYEPMPQPIVVAPPVPLPAEAGRFDMSAGGYSLPLFLDDGCAVYIFGDRIQRVRLDGLQRCSSARRSAVLDSIVNNAGDFSSDNLVTPEPAARVRAEEPLDRLAVSSAPARINGLADSYSARSTRAERPSRTARSLYGRYGRRSRNPRYIDDDSSEEEDEEDDTDNEDDGDEGHDSVSESQTTAEQNGNGQTNDAGGAIEYHCDICSNDCSRVRYHCATRADMDLCESCFKEAKYPSTMQPRDFIQMIAAPSGMDELGAVTYDPHVWSESETLLLLEALEMYGDRWDMVAEHVASKNHIQCILQFLRLPVEEAFYAQLREKWWSSTFPGSGDIIGDSPFQMLKDSGARENALLASSCAGPLSESLSGRDLIFSDSASAITPHVALLSSHIPPRVICAVLSNLSTRKLSCSSTYGETNSSCAQAVNEEDKLISNRISSCGALTSVHDRNSPPKLVHAMNALHRVLHRDTTDRAYPLNDEHCVTDTLYKDLMSSIDSASAIAVSDAGYSAAQHAIRELLHESDLPQAPASLERTSTGAKSAGTAERYQSIECMHGENRGSVDDMGGSKDHDGNVGNNVHSLQDLESDLAQCVATTATVAAALRCQRLAEAESLEIERLYNLIYEIKLEMIGMKLDFLEGMVRHNMGVREFNRIERCKHFGEQYLVAEAKLGDAHGILSEDKRFDIIKVQEDATQNMRDVTDCSPPGGVIGPCVWAMSADIVHPRTGEITFRTVNNTSSVPSRSVPVPPLPPELPTPAPAVQTAQSGKVA